MGVQQSIFTASVLVVGSATVAHGQVSVSIDPLSAGTSVTSLVEV